MSLKVEKVKIGKREYQLVRMRALNEPKRARIQVVRPNGTLWEDDTTLPKEQYNALLSCVAMQPSLAGTGNLYVAALMRPYDNGTKWLFKTIDGGVRFGIPAAWEVNKVSKSEDEISSEAVSSLFLEPSEGTMNYALQSANAGQIIQKLIKWKCSSPAHNANVFSRLNAQSWNIILKADMESPCYTLWECQECLGSNYPTGRTLTQYLIEVHHIDSPWKRLAVISTCSVCKDNPTLCSCNPGGCNFENSYPNCADILRLYLEEEALTNGKG